MVHPHTELRLISRAMGYGVFATEDIPQGTITWALDPLDRVIHAQDIVPLSSLYRSIVERYTWTNSTGDRILCWDFGRYVNHSCEANSLSPGSFDFEIAVRDIPAGEQILSDYGTLNIEEPMKCECGAPSCRGVVKPSDFETYADEWDRQIRESFPMIGIVRQPLLAAFRMPAPEIARCVDDPSSIPSVLLHRFTPTQVKSAEGSSI